MHATHPQIVERDGQPVVNKLFVDQIRMEPTRWRALLATAERSAEHAALDPGAPVLDDAHELRGMVGHLGREIVDLPGLRQRFLQDSHSHPDRESFKGFSALLKLKDAPYYLHLTPTGEWHHLEALEVSGDFGFEQRGAGTDGG